MQQPDLISAARQATAHMSDTDVARVFEDTVIMLSAPRSGSTLLFEQLMREPQFWTIGGESHAVFRAFPNLRAENPQLDSMALTEAHAGDDTIHIMRRCFLYFLRSNQGAPFLALPPAARPEKITFLEKTPRNALNIPFLLKLFPSARFIYLHRDPRQTVSSLIEAWTLGLQTGRFVTFQGLPGWHLPAWCFLLPRGWRSYIGKTIPEIAAFQWAASNEAIMDGLSGLSSDRYAAISYSDLVADASCALNNLMVAFGYGGGTIKQGDALPYSRTTVSAPHPDKWKRHEMEIEPLLPLLMEVQSKIEGFTG